MKNQKIINLFLSATIFFSFNAICFGQSNLLKRTTYKTDTVDFGVGGTVSIIGAPNGSIEVEGWQKNEVEISAEIEVQAENEIDLAKLAAVVGFITDTGFAHTRIISIGTNDKKYLKSVAKKFPKNLLAMPFRIDYKIKVPIYCDLEIDGGIGDLNLSKVEGTMRIKFLETNAKLDLVGGTISASFGKGNIDVNVPSKSWRGRNVDVQLISGTMNVQMPQNLNAELDAKVLRSGQIENSLKDLKKRDRTEFTDKIILAKSGGGGATLSFIVGDGTLKLGEINKAPN
jgi:hypothetical protein